MPYKRRGGRAPEQPDLFDSTPTYRGEVEEFINKWNSLIYLPRIEATARQAHDIRIAMMRPYFKNNWRKGFEMIAKSSFVWSKMRPAFRIDWYLIDDNFDKIMEGKYLDEQYREAFFFPNGRSGQTTKNGDDEEII